MNWNQFALARTKHCFAVYNFTLLEETDHILYISAWIVLVSQVSLATAGNVPILSDFRFPRFCSLCRQFYKLQVFQLNTLCSDSCYFCPSLWVPKKILCMFQSLVRSTFTATFLFSYIRWLQSQYSDVCLATFTNLIMKSGKLHIIWKLAAVNSEILFLKFKTINFASGRYYLHASHAHKTLLFLSASVSLCVSVCLSVYPYETQKLLTRNYSVT